MENKQQDVIEQIEQRFKDAIPNPTYEKLSVQLGCHFEEVCESMEVLDFNTDVRDEVRILSDKLKRKDLACLYDCRRCSTELVDKIELVDAMADQIVTAIGVLYLLVSTLNKF